MNAILIVNYNLHNVHLLQQPKGLKNQLIWVILKNANSAIRADSLLLLPSLLRAAAALDRPLTLCRTLVHNGCRTCRWAACFDLICSGDGR